LLTPEKYLRIKIKISLWKKISRPILIWRKCSHQPWCRTDYQWIPNREWKREKKGRERSDLQNVYYGNTSIVEHYFHYLNTPFECVTCSITIYCSNKLLDISLCLDIRMWRRREAFMQKKTTKVTISASFIGLIANQTTNNKD